MYTFQLIRMYIFSTVYRCILSHKVENIYIYVQLKIYTFLYSRKYINLYKFKVYTIILFENIYVLIEY